MERISLTGDIERIFQLVWGKTAFDEESGPGFGEKVHIIGSAVWCPRCDQFTVFTKQYFRPSEGGDSYEYPPLSPIHRCNGCGREGIF